MCAAPLLGRVALGTTCSVELPTWDTWDLPIGSDFGDGQVQGTIAAWSPAFAVDTRSNAAGRGAEPQPTMALSTASVPLPRLGDRHQGRVPVAHGVASCNGSDQSPEAAAELGDAWISVGSSPNRSPSPGKNAACAVLAGGACKHAAGEAVGMPCTDLNPQHSHVGGSKHAAHPHRGAGKALPGSLHSGHDRHSGGAPPFTQGMHGANGAASLATGAACEQRAVSVLEQLLLHAGKLHGSADVLAKQLQNAEAAQGVAPAPEKSALVCAVVPACKPPATSNAGRSRSAAMPAQIMEQQRPPSRAVTPIGAISEVSRGLIPSMPPVYQSTFHTFDAIHAVYWKAHPPQPCASLAPQPSGLHEHVGNLCAHAAQSAALRCTAWFARHPTHACQHTSTSGQVCGIRGDAGQMARSASGMALWQSRLSRPLPS